MNVLIDTDILIEVLRARDGSILTAWLGLSESDDTVFYSTVTAAELRHGMRPREEPSVSRLLNALIAIPVDLQIARLAGEYLRRFRASHGVELGDSIIAASAAVQECTLWTHNRKHYPMKDFPFF